MVFKMKRREIKQQGMTLVELVIVIVVLGIIAAVAAPRFVDISGNALSAGEQGSIGAFKSALAITMAEQQNARPTWNQITNNLDGFDVSVPGKARVNLDGIGADDVDITGFSDPSCITQHSIITANSPTLSWHDNTNCYDL